MESYLPVFHADFMHSESAEAAFSIIIKEGKEKEDFTLFSNADGFSKTGFMFYAGW